MSNITVKCGSCGAEFTVPASLAGERAVCKCGQHIQIPRPGQEAAAAPGPSLQQLQADKWYINQGGQTLGPLSFDDVKTRVLHGELKLDQTVYAACLGGWRQVSDVEALRPGAGQKTAEEQWFVSVQGKRYGPYPASYMEEMIKAKRLTGESVVWSPSMGDWHPLSRVARFEQLVRAVEATDAVEEMWYFMRDNERVGPLSLDQLVRAGREGRIRPDDRVWSNRLGAWTDPATIPELSEAMRAARMVSKAELWYYKSGDEVGGPIGFEELARLVETKKVRAGDTVFSKTIGTWKDIRNVPELEPAIIAAEAGLGRADSDKEQWYFRAQGKERGPVSERFLAEMVAKGTLKGSDQIWCQSVQKWQPVSAAPQFARYLSTAEVSKTLGDETVVEATEIPTSMVETGGRGMSKWKIIGLVAIGVLIVGLAVVLFIEGSKPKDGGKAGPKGPKFEVPKEPNAFLKAWLDLFLKDTTRLSVLDRDAHTQKLSMFSPDGGMDACAADVRNTLMRFQRSPRGGSISFEQVECSIRRAEDSETFCYHTAFRTPDVMVKARKPAEGGQGFTEVEKKFRSLDFKPLRMYQVVYKPGVGDKGTVIHPSALALVMEAKGGLQIVAFGRMGHVGAQAGPNQVTYITGFKSPPPPLESSCLLLPGITKLPGAEKDDWEKYGEVLSVDSTLVPQVVMRCKDDATTTLLSLPQLVVLGETGLRAEKLQEKYGPPSRIQEFDLGSNLLERRQATEGGGKLYSMADGLYYGKFAFAADKESGEVVAFLFHIYVNE